MPNNNKIIVLYLLLAIILIASVFGMIVLMRGRVNETGTLFFRTKSVNLYFNNSQMDPGASCNKVFPVKRRVKTGKGIEIVVLQELLGGPTDKEKEEGFFTNINPGVKIQNLDIKEGVAKVDFDEQLEFPVGGSCRVAAIRAEITETLKQFPYIKEVIISIDGRTEDILQP